MSESTAPSRATSAARAVESFLGRYKGNTRRLYEIDMRIFTEWCESVEVDPLQATRAELERFARHLEHDRGNGPSTVAHRLGVLKIFYRMALADDIVRRDPTVFLNMPAYSSTPPASPGSTGTRWADCSAPPRTHRRRMRRS